MVDYYGNWTYGPATPENKKCACDRIADAILASGYTPKTTMENLVEHLVLIFDAPDYRGAYDPETGFGGYGEEFTVNGCLQFAEDSGGFKEFDCYY